MVYLFSGDDHGAHGDEMMSMAMSMTKKDTMSMKEREFFTNTESDKFDIKGSYNFGGNLVKLIFS